MALLLFALAAMRSLCLAGLDIDIATTNRVVLTLGSWQPSEEVIPKALSAIQSFLDNPVGLDERHMPAVTFIRTNAKDYRVQFVGVTRYGKKVIWCNFFPGPQTDWGGFQYWKQKRVNVFDGGAWFWRIYYDPRTNECSGFKVNGVA